MKTKTKTTTKNEKMNPIETFRSGVNSISIWEKTIKTEKFGKQKVYSLSLQRSYKDDEDEWQNTNSFRKQDIASLQVLLQETARYLLLNEPKEETSEDDEEDEEDEDDEDDE